MEIGSEMERIREWRDQSNILQENAVSLQRLNGVLTETDLIQLVVHHKL